jgi:CDP-6-deoxy-D-xylo-4-hexulose-3-dehydrase
MNKFFIPLMADNITQVDIVTLIEFLQQTPIPKLTNGPKVVEFEAQWSRWLGVKHSLFVNSGSSANVLTIQALKYLHGDGNDEIIVPPLTWVSDIAAVLHSGLKPVFCDINLKNLSFDLNHLKSLINDDTRAIFLTHVLGLNGLTQELLDLCKARDILLIEDVCESHGTTFQEKKVGSFGYASNFSFYFAHHLSTIEGGMVCTNDSKFYEILRCMRSHGMLRESTDQTLKDTILAQHPQVNKDFCFIAPSHNFRSTEINAVLGLSQLNSLDENNALRARNFKFFLERLDSNKYITDLELTGQSNYAFIVILKEPSIAKRDEVERVLSEENIEFRRGLSGGGSQIKQPYIKERFLIDESKFPNMEHIHHHSWYIGNYPTLEFSKLYKLTNILNAINV